MRIVKHKSKVSTVALVLVLTIAATLVALPAVSAQPTKKTYAYIGAVPNPVGRGQEVLLHVGITDYLYVYTDGWEGLTVTVEKPDGTTETLGPFRTDSTGGTGTTYTPDQVGTYYLQTHFPEQVYNWIAPPLFDPYLIGPLLYLASNSEKLALIVQEEPIEYYPGVPLPTEYWTRPIDAQLREWSSISGNWLAGLTSQFTRTTYDFFAPYTEGPETAHILWAKPVGVHGGLVGGELDPHSYEHGGAYEGKWWPPVIINGIVYYNRFEERGGTDVEQEVVAVDLRTGEEIWVRNWNNTRLTFGQLFYWDAWNYHGVFAYLWVVETVFDPATFAFTYIWHAYDAGTGRWVYTMTDVPGIGLFTQGFPIRGPKGEIYIYTVNLNKGWMTLWNSSRTVQPQDTGTSDDGSWRPHGKTYDAARGYEWNKTIPTGLPGSVQATFFEDRIIGSNNTGWAGMGDKPITTWGFSLEPGREVTLLFNTTWQPPPGDFSCTWGTVSLEDGVFTMGIKETRQWYGFSLDTGKQIWGPTEPEPYLNYLVFGGGTIAYGKLFTAGYSGVVHCYDVKNGSLLWTYEVADPYQEILWSNNWPMNIAFAADGKIYLYTTEHSPINPLPRGGPFICLNATTGEELWSIPFYQSSWAQNPAIADGIIVNLNSYDNRIYAIGKGPSATTVTAPDIVQPLGTPILIKGTVTDESPGAKGTPAIADEDMSEWMKYLYMQFPIPSDATGVEVTLDAVDPNGNWIHIGTVTSDMSGMFKKMWTPEVPGEYTIIATFPGSESYWPSYAETAIGVSEAPPALPLEEPEEAVDYTPMFLGLIAAVVVVAILVLYTLWTVRKQRK